MPEMKVPTKKLDTSDCVIHLGRVIRDKVIVSNGEEYPVHKGEWIEVIPIGSISQYLAYSKMISTPLDQGSMSNIAEFFDRMTESIAARIVDWNWTDMDGSPLPNPYKQPEVIRKLTEDEIIYLLNAIASGETAVSRKNALGLSQSSSSVVGQ